MIASVISALYFMLPAYIANMFPVIAAKLHLPFGNPINEKKFGSHKTWRGFYAGYVGALIMLLVQQYLHGKGMNEIAAIIDYGVINVWLFAFLFGVGALTGDLIKSFFKRRVGIKSGKPWFPFDQLDLVVGALIFVSPFVSVSWNIVLILLIVTPGLHVLTNCIAYWLGMKDVWW